MVVVEMSPNPEGEYNVPSNLRWLNCVCSVVYVFLLLRFLSVSKNDFDDCSVQGQLLLLHLLLPFVSRRCCGVSYLVYSY